jgi:hypothetical protein
MSKSIDHSYFLSLPSGQKVHPNRLIIKDGIFMWKHACVEAPSCQAHEAHIQKTAQRLEELNSWIMPCFEAWEALRVVDWYNPSDPELSEGISLYFNHFHLDTDLTYDILKNHISDHETLEVRGPNIFFSRC